MTTTWTDEERDYLETLRRMHPEVSKLLSEHAELKRNQCTEEERAVLDALAVFPDDRFQIDKDDEDAFEGAKFCAAVLAMRNARLKAERAKGGA